MKQGRAATALPCFFFINTLQHMIYTFSHFNIGYFPSMVYAMNHVSNHHRMSPFTAMHYSFDGKLSDTMTATRISEPNVKSIT